MKKMKAIVSVTLCLLMLWACFTPAVAINAEGSRITAAAKAPRQLNDGNDNDNNDPDPEPADSLDWDQIAPTLIAAAKSLFFTEATEVDVSALRIPNTDENLKRIGDLISQTPELLNIQGLCSVPSEDEPDYIAALKYDGDQETVAENVAKRDACEAAMKKLMYGISDDLSGYDKCLLLHDRLAAWVAYDQIGFSTEAVEENAFTAYGALVEGVAVCQGYSMAYMWMLEKLGITSTYETSKQLKHGWVKVILDDTAFYVDVTNDDPTYDVPGRVQHKNFLVSFETFKANHEDKSDYDDTLTDTTYEATFDKNSYSEIVRIRGNYYYMQKNDTVTDDTGTTVLGASLKRVSGSTDDETELLTVNTLTYSNLTHEGVEHSESWLYNPKMLAIGDKILYTDGKTVYAFDVRNQQAAPEEVYTLNDDEAILNGLTSDQKEEFLIQGLKQIDGKLFITAFNDEKFEPDTVEKYTVELEYCTHENKTEESHPSNICTETGRVDYFCKDCLKSWSESTTAGAHNLVLDEDATVAATCTTPETRTYKCTNPGCTYSEQRVENPALDPTNHTDIVTHPGTTSTCVTQGYSQATFCNACKTYVTTRTTLPLDPDNHENTVVTKEAFPASCEKDGWTQEISCQACGEVVTASVPVGALNHIYTETVVPPTCTKEGYTLHKCERCWKEYKDTIVPASGHAPQEQLIFVEAVAPTCSSNGYTSGYLCPECQTYTQGHVLLLKDSNKHVGYVELNREPTCTENGVQGARVCSGCGAYEKDENGNNIYGTVIPANGHRWVDEGVVVKKPTCTATGLVKRTCSVCNELVTSPIDELGHVDGNNDHFCDRCNKNLDENACPYCNKIHTGFFAPLTNFFHKIFYLVFGPKKVK